jgi:signal transduction histidine kinase/ActR/RegA family two-component response regulator
MTSAIFYRVNEDSGDLVIMAVSGDVGPEFRRGVVVPRGTGTVGLAVQTGTTVMTPDVLDDPRLRIPVELHGRIQVAPYRSVVAVPLIVHGHVIGACALGDRRGRRLEASEVALAEAFADQAAVALENARLFHDAETARARAEAANRTKDEFLATLSHELRTPLTAILGWARLLVSRPTDTAAMPRGLEVIERNARAQAQLVDDLLDVSRIITGKLRLDVRPVELPLLVEGALDAVRTAADARGIRLDVSLDTDAGPVAGDEARLRQILWNLLSNAVKFTPRGGRVALSVTRAGSDVAIAVTDSGKGIDPAFLPHIFERFRQADSTTTRTHGGLGLGLAIVRHLAELHGGSVQAESEGEGRGAVFTVRLPLAVLHRPVLDPGRDPRTRESGWAAGEGSDLRGVRVLLVEDETDTRQVVTAILEEAGASVTPVASVRDALGAVAHATPDVIVADIGMPDEDGYALMERLRTMERDAGHRVPALALTAYARDEDRARAMAAGYQLHMAKPVEPARLTDAVARLLVRRAS